jgi:CRISPR-associated protein Cmr5
MTRQQRLMSQAIAHVRSLREQRREVQTAYGGVCHKLPVLIRAAGLCQTLAYVEAKAAGGDLRAQGYRYVRDHVAAVLGVADPARLLDAVRGANLNEYMRQTGAVIQAWTYYQRFATSILEVERGEEEVAQL